MTEPSTATTATAPAPAPAAPAPWWQTEFNIGRPNQCGGNQWKLRQLTPITVIFGRNGSGKSILLRGLFQTSITNNHLIVPERGGDINYNANVETQEANPQSRAEKASRNLNGDYRQGTVARLGIYARTRGLSRTEATPEKPQTIEEPFNLLLPDFEFRITDDASVYTLRRRSNGEQVPTVSQLSSGEAQLFTIGLDLLTTTKIWRLRGLKKTLLLVDEPDTNLHPDMQLRLADFLVSLARAGPWQLVVTSHSTTLLAALMHHGRDQVGVIYLNNAQEEQVARTYSKYTQELTACLGGHVLMGPLFGARLLLVEGDDDYKVWSEVPRGHKVQFAVLPTNGDEILHYQEALESIMKSLQDKVAVAGYALVDSDKAIPKPTATNRQEAIPYLQLACHETENLFLTDEVLADMGHKSWDQAKQAITKGLERPDFKEPLKGRIKAAIEQDRTKVDLKGLVNPLVELLDPDKLLPWHFRVGAILKRGRPTGMLAAYLGAPVVDALWGNVGPAAGAQVPV